MSDENSSSGYRVGYARASTLEQDEALQRDALTAAGCQRIFVDKVSGKLEHRPARDAMLEQLRPGDSVTVWRLDRLGGSLRHLIDVVSGLRTVPRNLSPDFANVHPDATTTTADVPPKHSRTRWGHTSCIEVVDLSTSGR